MYSQPIYKQDDLGQLTISLGSVCWSAKWGYYWYWVYRVAVRIEKTYVPTQGSGSYLGLGWQLAMFGDISGCWNWGQGWIVLSSTSEARNTARHPTRHREAPMIKNHHPKMSIVDILRNSGIEPSTSCLASNSGCHKPGCVILGRLLSHLEFQILHL